MGKPGIRKPVMWLVFALNICVIASCISPKSSPPPSTQTINSSSPGFGSGSFITVTSIGELTNRSNLIVIGQVAKTNEIVNMARNPDDPSMPDEKIFIVGQVYLVSITQLLKGDQKTDTIKVVQREGYLGSSALKDESEIAKAKAAENVIPLSLSKMYLLFLEPMVGYPEGTYYVGVAHPWRFDVSNTEQVIPESPWEDAVRFFPPQSLDSILYQIDHPELLVSPYPPPGTPYP